MKRESRVAIEQKNKIIGLAVRSGDVVVLGELARSVDISEGEMRAVIEKARARAHVSS